MLLSKSQFVDEEKIINIIDSLRQLNAKANIITKDWNKLSLNKLKLLLKKEKVDFQDIFYSQDDFSSKKEID